MGCAEYILRLREQGFDKIADAQDGNILCLDRNGTHFEFMDPAELAPEEREDWLTYQLDNLQRHALGY